MSSQKSLLYIYLLFEVAQLVEKQDTSQTKLQLLIAKHEFSPYYLTRL